MSNTFSNPEEEFQEPTNNLNEHSVLTITPEWQEFYTKQREDIIQRAYALSDNLDKQAISVATICIGIPGAIFTKDFMSSAQPFAFWLQLSAWLCFVLGVTFSFISMSAATSNHQSHAEAILRRLQEGTIKVGKNGIPEIDGVRDFGNKFWHLSFQLILVIGVILQISTLGVYSYSAMSKESKPQTQNPDVTRSIGSPSTPPPPPSPTPANQPSSSKK